MDLITQTTLLLLAASALPALAAVYSGPNPGDWNTAANWESLWGLGILTAQGQSGLTGAPFSSYFVTSGTNIRDTPTALPYRLTYIPEPSGSLLTALAGTLLLARRRRSGAGRLS